MTEHYSDYAQFYDEGTKTDVASKVHLIKEMIERNRPAAKTLLELACGTGNVLALLENDYEVTGLDLSPQMLELAAKKLPEVELYEADMTNFKLGKKYDAVICVFDSVNHLLSYDQWEALFDRVNEHLNENGIFIMDVNTSAKLEKYSTLPPARTELNEGYQISEIKKDKHNVYHWIMDVHIPQTDGKEKIIHSDIPEVAFSLDQIEESLRIRFKTVKRIALEETETDEQAFRVYFTCTA